MGLIQPPTPVVRGARHYQGLPYSYDRITKIVDQLASLRLIDEQRALPGDHLRTGRQSRLRATSMLVDAFEAVHFQYDPVELIRLRNETGRLVDYADTDQTRRRRHELETINMALSKLDLTLPPECAARGAEHIEVCGSIIRVTPVPVLYRVYNRGRWDKGGRAYWWGQNLPSAVRARLLLNGEAATEVDFTALHPRMLYARRGVQMAHDPYQVVGFDRKLCKRALLVALNARSWPEAVAALMASHLGDRAKWPLGWGETNRLLQAVVDHNPVISS